MYVYHMVPLIIAQVPRLYMWKVKEGICIPYNPFDNSCQDITYVHKYVLCSLLKYSTTVEVCLSLSVSCVCVQVVVNFYIIRPGICDI